jgi:anaerobic ribonucleoside-triphosphate reductase activating protein
LPDTPIYIWTGYTYEELQTEIADEIFPATDLRWILEHTDILVDGPYIQEERDVTLLMRGSRNQRILHLVGGKILNEIK